VKRQFKKFRLAGHKDLTARIGAVSKRLQEVAGMATSMISILPAHHLQLQNIPL
jgi:hypothetical protein